MQHLQDLLSRYDGRTLGEPTGRDGDGTTRCDYVFADADPAIVVEMTSITHGPKLALGRELARLEVELDRLAVDEELGFWALRVSVGSSVRTLRPMLEKFLLSQKGCRDSLAHYSAAEAPEDLQPANVALLTRLLETGFHSAIRMSEGHGVAVLPPVAASVGDGGFSTLLRHAIADNAVKLGEERPAETHLYVDISLGVSNDPAKTPVPMLPLEVDVVWVNLGYWNSKYDYRTWRARRGAPEWDLLDHAWGQEPRLA